jgi:hypothetical protein
MGIMVSLSKQVCKNYREAPNRKRKRTTDQPNDVSAAIEQKTRKTCPAIVPCDRPKTSFTALPEELLFEIYR